MALRDGSQSGIGVVDVAGILEAFETINECHIMITFERKKYGSTVELQANAVAFERKEERQVAKPLASVSVRCLGTRLKTMEAVLSQLLYMLDGQLAAEEFRNLEPK